MKTNEKQTTTNESIRTMGTNDFVRFLNNPDWLRLTARLTIYDPSNPNTWMFQAVSSEALDATYNIPDRFRAAADIESIAVSANSRFARVKTYGWIPEALAAFILTQIRRSGINFGDAPATNFPFVVEDPHLAGPAVHHGPVNYLMLPDGSIKAITMVDETRITDLQIISQTDGEWYDVTARGTDNGKGVAYYLANATEYLTDPTNVEPDWEQRKFDTELGVTDVRNIVSFMTPQGPVIGYVTDAGFIHRTKNDDTFIVQGDDGKPITNISYAAVPWNTMGRDRKNIIFLTHRNGINQLYRWTIGEKKAIVIADDTLPDYFRNADPTTIRLAARDTDLFVTDLCTNRTISVTI